MVTGKTSEPVLVSGIYGCQDHPQVENPLIKGDQFPRCRADNKHKAVWELKKEENGKDQESHDEKKEAEEQRAKGKPESLMLQAIDQSISSEDILICKKKGFFAAINFQQHSDSDLYKLETIVAAEKTLFQLEIDEMARADQERLQIIRERFTFLKDQLEEKENIKQEFKETLKRMEAECSEILLEITEHYRQLREEIKTLGRVKETLIEKRMEQFEAELKKLISVYQNAEEVQNNKFQQDHEARNLKDSEKQFYYDYRHKLEDSFNDVQIRVRALEREGLNYFIARFLISIGWIAAFISSWFFALWYADNSLLQNNAQPVNTGLVTYILDNLRNFILHYGWLVSVLVFFSYIAAVLGIGFLCHRYLLQHGFLKKSKNDEKTDRESDSVEFNLDHENLLKTHLKASGWLEMWLKLAPFLTGVFLLLIILVLGSQNSPMSNYQSLSDSLSLQVIGLLTPIAFSALCFLYITKVIESKAVYEWEDSSKKPFTGRSRFSWEIFLSILFFFILIGLLIANKFTNESTELNRIGAWGFFVGCVCTGLALGYGYRFMSLKQSFNLLADAIHEINQYIEAVFYPFQTSYLKHKELLFRMRTLYHSLLNLMEEKNILAAKLLNPGYKASRKNNEASDPPEIAVTENRQQGTEPEKEERPNSLRLFLKVIAETFRLQKEKIKEKDKRIKELEEQMKEMKTDSLDVEDSIYFPAEAAKLKAIKALIEERNRSYLSLREELDGYYRNEKTFASIGQQIEKLNRRKVETAEEIRKLEAVILREQMAIRHALEHRVVLIKEGYRVGLWFAHHSQLYN